MTLSEPIALSGPQSPGNNEAFGPVGPYSPWPYLCPSTHTLNPLTMGSHDVFTGTFSQLGKLTLGAQRTY